MSNQVREMERRFREKERQLSDPGRFGSTIMVLTSIFYLVVPVAGFVVGNLYLLQDDEDIQMEGRRYMALSFVNFLVLLGGAVWSFGSF